MKSITFDQLKNMLKSMSNAVFKRMGALEDVVKPPSKPKFMQYVTDVNGNAIWEERTHYHGIIKKSYTCVSATGLPVDADNATAFITQPFEKEVEVGETYKVTYNGVEYESQAVEFEMEGVPCTALGNIDLVTEQGDNGMPFLVVIIPQELVEQVGCTAIIFALYGATTVDISITFDGTTEVVKKIPQKFLPEQKFGETEEEVIFLPETTVVYEDGLGGGTTPFTKEPKPGETVIVKLDGVEYECKVSQSSMSEYYSVVIGDGSILGGAEDKKCPFGIAIIKTGTQLLPGMAFRFVPGSSISGNSTYTISVYIPKGFIKTLDSKYLNKSIGLTLNIRSTKYDALVAGKEFNGDEVFYTDLTPEEVTEMFTNGRYSAANLYAVSTDESTGRFEGSIIPLTPTFIVRELGLGGVRVHLTNGNILVRIYSHDAGIDVSGI